MTVKIDLPDERDPATGRIKPSISMTIDQDLVDAVDFLARQQRRTRSNMIEVLIQHGLVAEASYKRQGK